MTSLGENLAILFLIFLAIGVMVGFPLLTIAAKNDDISNLAVQKATTEYENKVLTIGTITQEDYDNFLLTLASTGNSYEVEMTVQTLDENPSKKATGSKTTIGNNVYYVKYTTQILQELPLKLTPGSNFSVVVKIKSKSPYKILLSWVYKVTGNDTAEIVAQASGMVSTPVN